MRKPEIQLLGHVVNKDGVKPDATKQVNLQNFQQPANIKELRSFLGLAAYVGQKFIPKFTAITSPLWELMHGPDFQWNNSAQNAFEKVKQAISAIRPLSFFNKDGIITVRTDASGIGISGILCCDNNPVLCTSRKLSLVEQRYSHIEKEFLAIVYALYRFKAFLFGLEFTVLTDNKPLISFFNRKIDDMPIRIQRWMLSLQTFTFRLQHVSGRDNQLADYYSRTPTDGTSPLSDVEQTVDTVCLVTQSLPPLSLQSISDISATDTLIAELREAISTNWPFKYKTNVFYSMRNELSVSDDGWTVFFKSRIILPECLQKKALTQAHEGHLGATKMKQILRTYFFWFGMGKDVDQWVRQCETCLRFTKCNKSAPLEPIANQAKEAWDTISLDFTGPSSRTAGNILLTCIDHFSRFPFAFLVKSSSAKDIISCLQALFNIFGIPRRIVTDNGSSFVSDELLHFTNSFGIQHSTSSVYFPSSNGLVERLHRTLKHRLDKLLFDGLEFTSALQQTLFTMRTTIHEALGRTPFAAFFGRECRTKFSTLHDNVSLSSTPRDYDKIYTNRNVRSKASVISFAPGTRVLWKRGVKDKFTQAATIVKRAGRSAYVLQSGDGSRTTVNQKFIRPSASTSTDTDDLYRAISIYMEDPIVARHHSEVPADQMGNSQQILPPARPARSRKPPDRLAYTKW